MDNHTNAIELSSMNPLPQFLGLNSDLVLDSGIKLENGTTITNSAPQVDFKVIQELKTDLPSVVKAETSQIKPKTKKKSKPQDFVSSILDQDNDNVIDFFENIDPMLAWALLKSKILPQVGPFDLLAEKAKYVINYLNNLPFYTHTFLPIPLIQRRFQKVVNVLKDF